MIKDTPQRYMMVQAQLTQLGLISSSLASYRIGRKLGQGTEGIVLEAFLERSDQTIHKLAMKVSAELSRVDSKEFNAVKEIKHENVVRVLELFTITLNYTPGNAPGDTQYGIMIMEKASCNLLSYVNNNFMSRSLDHRISIIPNLLTQLINGLFYIHQHNFMHRDLKPENILCFVHKSGQVELKIADFGWTKLRILDTNTLGVGTVYYTDPYICNNQGQGQYGFEIDLFSLGVILYYMIDCHYPWKYEQLTMYDPEAEFNWQHYYALNFKSTSQIPEITEKQRIYYQICFGLLQEDKHERIFHYGSLIKNILGMNLDLNQINWDFVYGKSNRPSIENL